MITNLHIPAIGRILRSGEAAGSMASVLYSHYSAILSEDERKAFVVALIGELLVERGIRKCISPDH